MKVGLVPSHQDNVFRHALRVDAKQVYDLALDVIQPKWKERKDVLDKLNFIYDKSDACSGLFTFPKDFEGPKEVTLNLARIRTFRDLVYTAFHEWRHALQYQKYGRKFMRNNEKSRLIEQDADEYAFAEELKMRYRNMVINPHATYSIFVERKKTF